MLYVVETGESIQSVEDLKGKTIYSTGKGTTPEFALNYILRENGIDPETDVTIEYKSEATEVAAALAETDDAIAVLPQPFVTTAMMQNDKLRIALSLTDEWDKLDNGSTLVTGVTIIRTDVLEENPAAVEKFLEEYEASINYTETNAEDAAKLIAQYEIVPKEPIALKALPGCNIHFIKGEEMKEKPPAIYRCSLTPTRSLLEERCPMTLSTIRNNPAKQKKVKTKKQKAIAATCAVAFWLLVWHVVSLCVGSELVLVSPVKVVQTLFTVIFDPDFLKTVWYSAARILGGFFTALTLGTVLGWVASRFWIVETLLRPITAVIKATPVASFIILVLLVVFRKKFVRHHLHADGLPRHLHERLRGHPQRRRKIARNGAGFQALSQQKAALHLPARRRAVFRLRLLRVARTMLEKRHRRRGHRHAGRLHRRGVLSG